MKEPWDSPNNVVPLSTDLFLYSCPADGQEPAAASYFAVIGPQTAWPLDRGRLRSEITDDGSQTILLLEAPHRHVPWGAPEDLTFKEAIALLTGETPLARGGHAGEAGWITTPRDHLLAVFVDGSVQVLSVPMPWELATALLTVDGGEKIEDGAWHTASDAELDYVRAYALVSFLGLSLLPWGWRAWRRIEFGEGSPASC